MTKTVSEKKIFKKTILVDLDGVLNQYTGTFDETFIPPAKEGAKEFLKNLTDNNFEVRIFTTRNKLQTAKWLIENGLDKYVVDITNVKELAWLYVDDRCVCFDCNYSETFENIQNYKPWYKK